MQNLPFYILSYEKRNLPNRQIPPISIFSDYGLDKTDQFCFIAVDGTVGIIFRHQPHVTVLQTQAFDGGFVTNTGDYNLPVVRILLGADNYHIATENACIYHAVAPYPQGKATGVTVPTDGAFLIFQRQNRHAGGDNAYNGNLTGALGCDNGALASLGAGGQKQTLCLQLL